MADKTIGVALLGCGTVGCGVARILSQQGELIRRRTGLVFEIRHFVDKDTEKKRPEITATVHSDAARAINDPQTQIIIELIGGTGAAHQFSEMALKLGKPVVTANKSLLARRGPEMFALAREHNSCIAFEASCAGGIPIINAIMHGLGANRIDTLIGIVNGTCNFILTRMTQNGWSYSQALVEAQKAGFAETDPTLDVAGRDAAQKLALLASLAFNVRIKEDDIFTEGIDKLTEADIRLAGELGYVIKLLAIGQRHGEKISLRVHPALVRRDDVLADVGGSFNAVSIYGDAVGHVLFYGRGAGQMPAASAVVADLINVALGVAPMAFRQLSLFPDQIPPAQLLAIKELNGRYFLRLTARDEPGVMAQVTQILGRLKISLSAILQHEENDGQLVPVVVTTHMANEGAVQQAIAEIDRLPTIKGPSACLRIMDQPEEYAKA